MSDTGLDSDHGTADRGAAPVQEAHSTQSHRVTIVLFALTSFVGAALLFVVQPLVARLVLPLYGGSATVWSTSNLFFQVVLLVGYFYAHVTTRRLTPRSQPVLHMGILLLPLVALPIALPADAAPGADASPVLWLLRTLTLVVGLPFAVISTTGPLLQRWYSWTGAPRADDPYFLYATSNLGSFVGLLAYPFLIEPFVGLDEQRIGWSVGFVVFLLLMAMCGLITVRYRSGTAAPARETRAVVDRLPLRQVLYWLTLAFIPSSLMLGVTAHISTDIAAIPLLWVVPLAIYLATFIVAFARTSRTVSPRTLQSAAAISAVAAVAYVAGPRFPVLVLVSVNLVLLAAVAYAAHSRLAASRPAPEDLTSFYLVVSAGGALGGLLNGMIAPVLFTWVWEFPAIVAVSALLAIGSGRGPWGPMARRYHPAFVFFLEAGLAVILLFGGVALTTAPTNSLVISLTLAVVVVGAYLMALRPAPLAAATAFVLAVVALYGPPVLLRERSFYGSYRVTEADGLRYFSHGTTVHGSQFVGERGSEPTSYYARSGPVGDVFREIDGIEDVGAVGLGVGTIAAYGVPGQTITFYELDPAVVEIAANGGWFSYLGDSEAQIGFQVGDGRLRLAEAGAQSLDLLVLDAFSSDSIPVHLLTREAFEIYANALKPDGVLLVHISNRVFDLEPVVTSNADHLGWTSFVGTGEADDQGATASEWVALSATEGRLEPLAALNNWRLPSPRSQSWTDDYSSVLTVLR